MPLLGFKVMLVNLQAETNFLDFGGALVTTCLTLFDLLVVLVLAIVNELGNGRLCIRRHLNQIEIRFLGQIQSNGGRDDPNLLAVRADQAYLRDAYLVVNAWFCADDELQSLLPFGRVIIESYMPQS